VATVVVLPDVAWTARHEVLDGIAGAVDVRGSTATEVCGDLVRLQPDPPLVIVAYGSSCALLPAVALAQRTAHRRVSAYVLVDPLPPTSSDAWPDAPVTVVTDDAQIARLSALRGWSVSDLDVVTVNQQIARDAD
jgi:hypothetical protein